MWNNLLEKLVKWSRWFLKLKKNKKYCSNLLNEAFYYHNKGYVFGYYFEPSRFVVINTVYRDVIGVLQKSHSVSHAGETYVQSVIRAGAGLVVAFRVSSFTFILCTNFSLTDMKLYHYRFSIMSKYFQLLQLETFKNCVYIRNMSDFLKLAIKNQN